MEIIAIMGIIISLILFSCGAIALKEAKRIKVWKDYENEQRIQERIDLLNEIEDISNRRDSLKSELENEEYKVEEEKNKLSKQLDIYKQNINSAKEKYISELEDDYIDKENEYDDLIEQLKYESTNVETEFKNKKIKLEELKNTLAAGVQAQLREREKEEKLQFYKLSISPIDLEDITKLCSLKIALHNPVILSKLIWTQYFLKQAGELCNRVFGKEAVCGIYKITNVKTKQCYIGQSVNIQDRIKQHIRCGLGIDAPATNKLYNAMQSDGVWNYTFELIEKCSREELDKKEKQWIEMYQANIYGFNATKGNH